MGDRRQIVSWISKGLTASGFDVGTDDLGNPGEKQRTEPRSLVCQSHPWIAWDSPDHRARSAYLGNIGLPRGKEHGTSMATFGVPSWGAAGVGNGPNIGRWVRMAD